MLLAQQAGGAQQIGFIVPLVLMAVVFYLLVFRPMKSRQRKLDAMITGLKSGDRVITSGGIYGTIAAVKDKTFLLKVSDQVKIEVAKSAVAGLQSEESPPA